MGLLSGLKREWVYFTSLTRAKKRLSHVAPDMTETAADIIEHFAKTKPDNLAIINDAERYSYKEFNDRANRYAEWAAAQGLTQGDCVALLMENRPDFLFAWLGMAKLGVITALINTNLQGHALAHTLTIAKAKHVILGGELAHNYVTAQEYLDEEPQVWLQGTHNERSAAVANAHDMDQVLPGMTGRAFGPADRPDLRGGDVCFYIYTSGTTGLPKAANFSHMRLHAAMHGFSAAVNATENDRMYVVLPLYHSAGGVAAIGTTLSVGGAVILRRKFSAHKFWDDVSDHGATLFQYIGELCRYLLNTDEHPKERSHKLRVAVGNGLRPEIWERFQTRFNIPKIVEFYGATEGNVTLFNFDGHTGSIGRVPFYAKSVIPVTLVQFDVEKEEPVRGPDGFCRPCEPGQVGEALGKIGDEPRTRFEGYSNAEATKKKILTDVFETGDRYFRTGDLLRQDKLGYYYFVDRIGDTFRWKGENVATSEVAEALSVFPGVKEANVYGVQVPGADGRAGMAALVTDQEIDLGKLYAHAAKELPAYAQPLFIRLQGEIEITGTFKHRKGDLVKEGFDPSVIADPLFFRDDENQTYRPLDQALHDAICSGEVRL